MGLSGSADPEVKSSPGVDFSFGFLPVDVITATVAQLEQELLRCLVPGIDRDKDGLRVRILPFQNIFFAGKVVQIGNVGIGSKTNPIQFFLLLKSRREEQSKPDRAEREAESSQAECLIAKPAGKRAPSQ